MTNDFRGLETFLWVANLGSFRSAAAKLNATQPAVSQRIAQLERELGGRLLERTSRSVRLTERGREILPYAERIVRLGAEMRARCGETGGRGTLRLGVAETIVQTWLSRFVEGVAERYPELALEIEVDTSPHLRTSLLTRHLDLAFMLGPLAEPGLKSTPLSRFELRFLASPRLALPSPPLSVHDLARLPLITFARGTQPHAELREAFSRAGAAGVRIHASAALGPVVKLAAEGVGVAVVPPAVAEAELADGRLVLVPTELSLPDLAFHACARFAPGSLAEIATEIAVAAAAEHRSEAAGSPSVRPRRGPEAGLTR